MGHTWEEIPTLIAGHNSAIESIKVIEHEPETLLVTCGGDGDNSVKVWGLHSGRCLHTFKDHRSGVWCADFVCAGSSSEEADIQTLLILIPT